MTQLVLNAVNQKTVSSSYTEMLHRQSSLTSGKYKLEKTSRISFRPVSLQQSLKPSRPFDIDLVINCLLFFLHIQRGCKSLRNPKTRFIYLFILVYYTAIYMESQHVQQHREKQGQNIATHCYSSAENTETKLIYSTCKFGLHITLTQSYFKPVFKKIKLILQFFSHFLCYRELLLPFHELWVVVFFLSTIFFVIILPDLFHQEMGVQKSTRQAVVSIVLA